MGKLNFADALWKKQKKYMDEINAGHVFSRFVSFRNVFNYFQNGQTVAQINCGNIMEDLFHTMERVGKEGKIILIDEKHDFIYDRAVSIVGKENLPQSKQIYVQTKKGKKELERIFNETHIYPYVQHLPPYPVQIKDCSLDHVIALNSAFEMMAQRHDGPKADPGGIVVETYKKLKNNGSFLVQGILGGDAEEFGSFLERAKNEHNLNFEREWHMKYPPLLSYATGEWIRWIKKY